MYKLVNIILTSIVLSISAGHSAFTQPQVEGTPQDSSKTIVLYFRFNRSLLEKEYMTNEQELRKLCDIMSKPDIVQQIDSIIIKATASPDGSLARNQQLSAERAAAVKSYLMWQYPFLDRNSILTYAIGENWKGLKEMVEKDKNMPYRNEVIHIIDSDDSPQIKDSKLRQLKNGTAFAYITRHMLRFLRSGTTHISFYSYSKKTETPIVTEQIIEQETETIIKETPINGMVAYPHDTTGKENISSIYYKRPIAFKTNLLFDAVTLLNVEVEVPVANRFSIAGELLFPSWSWKKNQSYLKILSGTLEGRYWPKPDYSKQDASLTNHNPLTGWFLGVYSSIGKYDLEWKKEGYQGKFYLSTGLSLGYVLPVKRNLNMEFSLSAGYLQTDYWRYQSCQTADGEWHLIKQYPGTYRWLGPTRLKISLVWYPHFKMDKKGGVIK